MKHGRGKQYNANGSVYEGQWEGNLVKGMGTHTVPVGQGPLGGPKEVCCLFSVLYYCLLWPFIGTRQSLRVLIRALHTC